MTPPPPYIPDRGDLVWIDFDPQVGREQSGFRPALVLSRARTHTASGLAFVVPITSRSKGYDTEFPLPAGLPVYGVLLCDQTKSVDWRGRNMRPVGVAPIPFVDAVAARVYQLLT
jgi:mRNA interferase MazF